jgi:hypothetical protein
MYVVTCGNTRHRFALEHIRQVTEEGIKTSEEAKLVSDRTREAIKDFKWPLGKMQLVRLLKEKLTIGQRTARRDVENLIEDGTLVRTKDRKLKLHEES